MIVFGEALSGREAEDRRLKYGLREVSQVVLPLMVDRLTAKDHIECAFHLTECAECEVTKVQLQSVEFSGRAFGTILKSDTLTFQSVSIYPSPVKDCSGGIQETLF